MQKDRSLHTEDISKFLKDKGIAPNKQGCIYSVPKPVNGGNMHYWAVIKDINGVPKVLLKKQIGYKTSQDGEVHDICFVNSNINKEKNGKNVYRCDYNKQFQIIAKLIPISTDANKSLFNLAFHPWKELLFTTTGSSFVLFSFSPHFMKYYGYYRCNHADKSMFKNVNIIRRLGNKAITTELKKLIVDIGIGINKLDITDDTRNIILPKYEALEKDINRINKSDYGAGVLSLIVEKGDTDLSHYLDGKSFISPNEIEILVFQLLQSLLCIHEFGQFIHLDLHLYNVLVKNSPKIYKGKQVYRKYIIFDHTFYVENNDVDIMLIDFGRSEYLPLMTVDELATEAKAQHNFLFDTSKTNTYYNNVKYNLTKNKKFYREYFKSFDVYRVFSELYASCKDQIEPESEKLLKGIIRDAKQDFLVNFATYIPQSKISKKHEYQGHPYTLIKKYFVEYGTFSQDLEVIEPEKWYNDYIDEETKAYTISKKLIKEYHEKILHPRINADRKKNRVDNQVQKNIPQPEINSNNT